MGIQQVPRGLEFVVGRPHPGMWVDPVEPRHEDNVLDKIAQSFRLEFSGHVEWSGARSLQIQSIASFRKRCV